jgi:hypothetical protein
VLILDDFDKCGHDNVNITNMKSFCHDLYRLQDEASGTFDIFVVILTQSRDVANELCRINNWKKITPMPGSYVEIPPEERDAATLPDPNWTLMPWSEQELLYLVAKRFTTADLVGINLDWIQTGQIVFRVLSISRSRRNAHRKYITMNAA